MCVHVLKEEETVNKVTCTRVLWMLLLLDYQSIKLHSISMKIEWLNQDQIQVVIGVKAWCYITLTSREAHL